MRELITSVDIESRSRFNLKVTVRNRKSNGIPCVFLENDEGIAIAMTQSYTRGDIANFAILAELWNNMSDDPEVLREASKYRVVYYKSEIKRIEE